MNCLAPSVISIRNFVPEIDGAWLHGLWHRALHGRWAISLEAMLNKLADASLLLVAECYGLRSGFCSIQAQQGSSAALTLLLVEPARQREGVGSDLLSRAEEKLKDLGVRKLTLGAGNGDYFWPGLPKEQEDSTSFFRQHGFMEEESSEDLIQDLQAFTMPTWVATRFASSCASICLGQATHENRIAAFERLHFPAWAAFFENEMRQGGYENILLAQGSGGDIIGTLLLRHDPRIPWTAMDGKRMGTMNTLGVAQEQQGQGIGLALTSRAMEILHRRGCSHCFIQWTGLAEWYGKLGAETWARYYMASKLL